MNELAEELIGEGYLKSSQIIEAFLAIDRADFVPEDVKKYAYLNEALPIGWEQTISQPLVVAFMLELLEPHAGEKILDIGSGSGWTCALLAHIVGETGKVIGIEVIEELAEFGRENLAKYNFIGQGRADIVFGSGAHGFSKLAPFDKMLTSASLMTKRIPKAWDTQLKKGGIIVFSMGESIWQFKKTGENAFLKKEYPGFLFVPFKE